ncbi:hypothetical protein [Bacteroides gallinaceum]|uniref:DUF4919 domain-containing protein n=1 Tax=Bacteroides gallinaceum TaxID=1462571 RepID=A0ABT7VGK0_9BACE|nr:hypothetical protein [Bacteroides gallinaceum]MDM8325260.1 hypothetical protein [Bacteroides gallinaceum]
MRPLLLFFAAFALSLSAKAQQSAYVMVDTVRLNAAYEALMKKEDADSQREYFDAFPKTWMQYIATFQYTRNNVPPTLYSTSHKFVNAFSNKLTAISADEYCKRAIDLCIGAEIDADAPNYLKSMVRQLLNQTDTRKAIFNYLSSLRIGHRFQFWFFYWSNITRSKDLEKQFADFYDSVKNDYSEEANIMFDAYKYAYNNVNFMSTGYLDGE